MTFNIRYGKAADGENSWQFRKDLVVETIRNFSPDIFGLQEALDFQIEYLRSELPGYAWVGVGREDGKKKGEFSPIFYRRDLFILLLWGTFWLSETPQIPGSKSWDSALPRIVTWAQLGLKDGSGQLLYLFNTHFDHVGSTARLNSSRLLRRWIDFVGPQRKIIVCGDFNAVKNSKPYTALLKPEQDPSLKAKIAFPKVKLVDCYAALNSREPPRGEGTFHGFTGKAREGRIDWVLTSADLRPKKAYIIRFHRQGRYPSDHFPVGVVLEVGNCKN